MSHEGDKNAKNILCLRYLGYQDSFLRYAYPLADSYLDEWDRTDAYIDSLIASIDDFDDSRGAQFKTFFLVVLRHEICRKISDNCRKSNVASPISLDFSGVDENGETYALSDILPGESTESNSPSMYLRQIELNEALEACCHGEKAVARKLLRFLRKGYTLVEACERLSITYGKGRYILNRIVEHLTKKGVLDKQPA